MEFQKILNLLDIASNDKDIPRFVTGKWIAVNCKVEEPPLTRNENCVH